MCLSSIEVAITKTQLTSPTIRHVCHNVWPELCVGVSAEVSTQYHY